MLSPAGHKMEIKPFFVKMPCHNYSEGVWNNFVIDCHSFIEAFKGQTYRSLDSISIQGHFKIRRIYTSTTQPLECQGDNQSQEIKPTSLYLFVQLVCPRITTTLLGCLIRLRLLSFLGNFMIKPSRKQVSPQLSMFLSKESRGLGPIYLDFRKTRVSKLRKE